MALELRKRNISENQEITVYKPFNIQKSLVAGAGETPQLNSLEPKLYNMIMSSVQPCVK